MSRRQELITVDYTTPAGARVVERMTRRAAMRSIRSMLHSAGFCRKCGRTLSDPTSVQLGIGPECRRKAEAS